MVSATDGANATEHPHAKIKNKMNLAHALHPSQKLIKNGS